MLQQYLCLPRAIHILSLGTLVNRAGTLVILFLTFYLQERMGLGGIFATQAIGFFGLGTLVAAIVGGHLADTIGRRTIILVSMFGGAALLMVYTQLRSPPLILAVTSYYAFLADMYRPAVSAMISDIVPVEQRPHAFSLMYIAINLGAAIAPLVGGMLAAHAFEYLFWGDALTCVAYGVIVASCIRETLPPKNTESSATIAENGRADPPRIGFSRVLRDATFVRFSLGTLFLSFVYMQAISTFPLYLKSLSFGPEVYGRTIALNGLLVVLLQVPMTHIVSRFNRTHVMMLAALTTGIGFGLKVFATTQTAFALTVFVWTLGELMQSPLVPSIVSDLAPPALRARYFGVLSMCYSGGNLIAAPIGGWVLVNHGGGWLWGGCVATALCSAALYASLRIRVNPLRP